jgi:hypothetical protein
MVLQVLLLAMIGGIVANKIPKKLVLIICILTIGSTMLNWGNRRTIPAIGDAYLMNELPHSSFLYEGSAPSAPVWTDPKNVWAKDPPASYLEIIKGTATIRQIMRNSTQHIYKVDVISKTQFKENTLYFPGWEVRANNKSQSINYRNPKHPGFITFELEPGKHEVSVRYTNTPIQSVSQFLSSTVLLLLLLYAFFPKRN